MNQIKIEEKLRLGAKQIEEVQDYWELEACGSHFVKVSKDRRDFYSKYEDYRYKVEWHIPELVPFKLFCGQKVLEIGCGNGIDGSMFAKSGADYTGVDLTQSAVEATRELFQLEDLNGKIQVENAENLSFEPESFDLVYSHGVIHHSPDPDGIVKEIERVLVPGGQVIVMLYHKHSFNYYFRVMLYMRMRLLLKILARFPSWKLDKFSMKADRPTFISSSDEQFWDAHYTNFLEQGWGYLKADNFIHKCTDGPYCPYAWVYTKNSAKKLFSKFDVTKTTTAHFPLRNSKFGGIIPLSFEKMLARWFGFYLFLYAQKPR